MFDPLDGSSNVDANIPTGTIFGVYEESESMENCVLDGARAPRNPPKPTAGEGAVCADEDGCLRWTSAAPSGSRRHGLQRRRRLVMYPRHVHGEMYTAFPWRIASSALHACRAPSRGPAIRACVRDSSRRRTGCGDRDELFLRAPRDRDEREGPEARAASPS